MQETQRLLSEPGTGNCGALELEQGFLPGEWILNLLLILLRASAVVVVFVISAPGISASPSEENLRYFNVMILGPSQSPYEGNLRFRFCYC